MSEESEKQILIYNAKIWASMERRISWFTFNETSGQIIETGDIDPPVQSFADSRKHDYQGQRICPGFQDAHIHVSDFGRYLSNVRLVGVASIEEFQNTLKDFAHAHPEKEWIYGSGWEHDVIGRYPTREDLDAVCRDRPVLLMRVCLHVGVANSKALEIMGITNDTPDPEGGAIDRFPVGHRLAGEPTGILRETAKDIFDPYIEPTDEDKTSYIKTSLDACLKFGLTAVHALEADTWKSYCGLADAGQLPIRVFYSAFYTSRHSENFPSARECRGDMLSCDRIKLFADGALGASTAAMSEHYVCQTHNKGLLLQSQETLNELVLDATKKGYRLEIHVIGDRAADSALTAIEVADVRANSRPILTHCQILRADLLPRMQAQGVVATVQPQFVATDSSWIHQRLPEHLLRHSYAWKTLRHKGIVCGGSSDAPVESPEPFIGMYDAIFRPVGGRDPLNQKMFRSEECLTIDEALDLYTTGSAYVTCRENDLGKLKPGYQADFVVVDSPRDICEHPTELLNARAAEVWVAGKRRL